MDIGIVSTLQRFFFPKEEVHKHWYSAVDGFALPSTDFYNLIQTELANRKVPGLGIERVQFSEGGLLSDKREYLRLRRERWVFDICAAPFGTSYFFSFRFVELPLGIKPLELLIFFIALGLAFSGLTRLFGFFNGFFAFLFVLFASIYAMRNAVVLGLKDLDAQLMKTPVIGPLYELFLRKETYYREDTRLMYLTTVNSITESAVEQVTHAKGFKLQRFDRKPVLGEPYQEKRFSPMPKSDALPAFASA